MKCTRCMASTSTAGGDVSVVTYPAFPQTSADLRSQATEHLNRPDEGEVPLGPHRHKLCELVLLAEL